jgi:hypothetical protein
MKYSEIFNPVAKGNTGLTEEFIYRSISRGNSLVPYWGGNRDHYIPEGFLDEQTRTKHNEQVTIFEGEGIIVSLDGSAGSMTYKKGIRFALNHHAGFITPKKQNGVDLEFFAWAFRDQLAEESVSEGSGTLSLETLHSMDFDLPKINEQRKIMSRVRPLLNAKRLVDDYAAKLDRMRHKTVIGSYGEYQAQGVSVVKILDYVNGNSGLTSSEIYSHMQTVGTRYQVLSGTTSEQSEFADVPAFQIKARPLKVFKDREGILIVRKGKAGASRFLAPGRYTLTDDAYILFLRDDCEYKVSLEWLAIQYSSLFYDYASSSDNGTWNMTGFFDNARIDIPTFEAQGLLVKRYNESVVTTDKVASLLSAQLGRVLEKRIALT